jgi:hypothetical protein
MHLQPESGRLMAQYRGGVPHWAAPEVECHTCGTMVTPIAVKKAEGLPLFWTLPSHRSFLGFAPGSCKGSGAVLSPVADNTVP